MVDESPKDPEPAELVEGHLAFAQCARGIIGKAFIDGLDLPADEKKRLLALTPAEYIGNATAQAKAV